MFSLSENRFLKCVQHTQYLGWHSRHSKKQELITKMHVGVKEQKAIAGQSREIKRNPKRTGSDNLGNMVGQGLEQ